MIQKMQEKFQNEDKDPVDFLRVLTAVKKWYTNHNGIKIKNEEGLWFYLQRFMDIWDLEEPLLKHQHPEIIEFIYSELLK